MQRLSTSHRKFEKKKSNVFIQIFPRTMTHTPTTIVLNFLNFFFRQWFLLFWGAGEGEGGRHFEFFFFFDDFVQFFFSFEVERNSKIEISANFFSRFVVAVSLLLREDDQSQWTVSGHVTRPGQWSVFSGVKNIFVEVKTCSRICVSLEYF